MSAYHERPWLARYPDGHPPDLEPDHATLLDAFRATAARIPERPAIHYFEGTLTFGELDALSDALAAALAARGFRPGDRLAVYLQNVPQFTVAMLAAWKAGGIMVSVNPMLRHKELRALLDDSTPTALVTLESLWAQVAREVVAERPVAIAITTSELDLRGEGEVPPLLAGVERQRDEQADDLLELAERHRGERPPEVALSAGDTAFLTYTSGTTGPPKGAMNSHGNVVYNAMAYERWVGLSDADVILGVAPLFHITGLIGHVAVGLLTGATLVLSYRFDPDLALALIERHRATYTVGSITVFIALMHAPEAGARDVSSLTKVLSGGAPIPAPTVEQFELRFGAYIHNIYGLTETTSPSHCVPIGTRAPVDEASGALSVGVPVYGALVRVVDDDGREVPPGEIGELVTSGPQVVPGYWNKPEETEHALPGGELHTGDVGVMDEDGWFYIVDRKKDMINASGYKVWPREVEDGLYAHEAVREAAVVGVGDPYRGETVKAFVALKPGAEATPEELIAFCRQRMAAYKYPREIELVDELPKTPTGKILRRELRG